MAPVRPIKIVKLLKSPVKIKIEPRETEDVNIPCRLCAKTFANEVAIRNHLRMEHSGEQVDLENWVQMAITENEAKKALNSQIKSKEGQQVIAKKTAELVSTMKPANVMSLASNNVSYIIIKVSGENAILTKQGVGTSHQHSVASGSCSNKTEDGTYDTEKAGKKRERQEKQVAVSPKRQVRKEREREVMPISGPFECLQPSTLVAEGTCHQIFFSCCDYSIHFRDEHTRRRKPIKCQVCEKVLAYSIGEEVTTPYSCQVCGAGFQSNKLLTVHMNTQHVKLKPFECGVCHKRFTQQGGVQQHMRMHTGDRPFPCTFCQKSFTQKSGLDQHLRTHTKVKPYRCVICSKTFIQSVHLKQHMRTHTNVSPFQCVICEKRFKQSSHLNYHLKHHNEANMTDDQKKKYHEFVGMISEQSYLQVEVSEPAAGDETVTLQEDQPSDETEETVQEGEIVQTEELAEGEMEQVIVEEDGREYIVTDNDNETWSVKVAY